MKYLENNFEASIMFQELLRFGIRGVRSNSTMRQILSQQTQQFDSTRISILCLLQNSLLSRPGVLRNLGYALEVDEFATEARDGFTPLPATSLGGGELESS